MTEYIKEHVRGSESLQRITNLQKTAKSSKNVPQC